MALKCFVRLNSPTKIFYPGEAVTGDIIILNNKARCVRGLQLRIKGDCSVGYSEREWTKGIDGKYRSQIVDHSAQEVYMYEVYNVFGNDGVSSEILPGRYEYPFKFDLPSGIPSSFKGKYGNVTYEITAVLPRSWAFDCKSSTPFHVMGFLDLSLVPFARQNSVLRHQKQLRNCCFFSSELCFVLHLQRCGVTIGEIVPLVLEISNKTSYHVTGKMSLIQEITVYTKGNQRCDRNIMCVAESPTVAPGGEEIWINNVLQVPLLPPSQLGSGCNLIDVSYELQFHLTGSGLFTSLHAWTPMIIGTLPINPPGHQSLRNE